MRMVGKNLIPNMSMTAGAIIAGVGGWFWWTTEQSEKLFQLSNELVGAGLFILFAGLIVRKLRK